MLRLDRRSHFRVSRLVCRASVQAGRWLRAGWSRSGAALEAGVRDYLTERAKAKGVPVSDLVNDLLKRDIEPIEAAK